MKTHYQHAVEQESRLSIINIEKHQFIQLYQQARQQVFDEQHITLAWKDTGLIPISLQHLYSQIPECIGRTRLGTLSPPIEPGSSSPLSALMASTHLETLKTLAELQHFDDRYHQFSSFSSIDASPSQKRHDKIVRTAQAALVGRAVMEQRYNQLLEETKQSTAAKKRQQKQIVTSGAVLTAELLDDFDYV